MGTHGTLSLLMALLVTGFTKTWATDGLLVLGGDYPYTVDLDDNYNLKWNTNSTHIIFQCRVKARGYVGFGISAHGDMYPGDMVIAWMSGSHVHFHDRHATDHVMPEIDKQQDWDLLEFNRTDGGHQTMTVVRKLNTCDEEEDLSIKEGTTRVIYSYNDVIPPSDDNIPYHGRDSRGAKSILLLDPPPIESTVSDMPDDVTTHDFVNTNYPVPSKDTTYSCVITKFQPSGGKHHVIRFEPVIPTGHERLVHHMLLYSCSKHVPENMLGTPFECYEEDISGACPFVMIGWGIGGTAFNYPKHVGHSLGTSDDPTHFRLEIHYDNSKMEDDLVDSSGIRMFLTKELRQYDAGTLQVGVEVGRHHIIPPGYDSFLSRGSCAPECFESDISSLWSDDDSKFPPVAFGDIYTYLVESPGLFTPEALKAYKSLGAYNFFQSGWAGQLYARKSGTGHCIVRAKVNRLGLVCSHVAAILFKLQYGADRREPVACTSQPCKWNKPSVKKVVGEEGIKIFADTLHSHLLGRKLQSRHIRNGVELPPIAKDDNYDFHYQETRVLPEEKVVKKGDTLITDCIYDSTGRSTVTFGGLSTRNEMCLAFIMYYPRTSLKTCLTRYLYQKNGVRIYSSKNFRSTDWSDEKSRQRFIEIIQESDRMERCIYTKPEKNIVLTSRPRIFEEYVPENECKWGQSNLVAMSAISCHVVILCACVISFIM